MLKAIFALYGVGGRIVKEKVEIEDGEGGFRPLNN